MNTRSRSFTLLEMLLVAVMLGLLASMGMRSLLMSTGSPTHTLRRIASIDAEARLIARRSGPCSIAIQRDGSRASTAISLVAEGQPHRFEFEIAVTFGDGLTEIAFDRHGQSVDYTVSIDGTSRTLRVTGLTGWSSIDGE